MEALTERAQARKIHAGNGTLQIVAGAPTKIRLPLSDFRGSFLPKDLSSPFIWLNYDNFS